MDSKKFQELRRKTQNHRPTWTGWRYAALIGGLVGAITLTLYPIAIEPMLNTKKYKEIQKKNRAGIIQEEVQPAGLPVWSNPYKPLPNKYDKE
ncbi:hypothetical protein PVAND_013626 [Polypedilum vanderplanki]|uniref:Uncharacterized protein n=1 Tax=Polypedilum vanderplanki TaxID=319348 RepID=A0A9J6CRA5_POLVA|nr:hypothetical protein PVAND_013626 [Polypedilum vanderplanki]